MLKVILGLLICLALASPVYAYRIDNTYIEPATSVTAETTRIIAHGTSVCLVKESTSVDRVIVSPGIYNTGAIYIGPDAVTGLRVVSNSSVTINVDNLQDLYVRGDIVGDTLTFLGEIR